jgi:hypothetical protein
MNNIFGRIVIAGVLAIAANGAAAVTLTLGSGSAVPVADRTATFDDVGVNTNLLGYTEDGLTISVDSFAYEGFNAFSTGSSVFDLHYGIAGNNSFVTITNADAADFFGLEMRVGTGFLGCMATDGLGCSIVWETLSNGITTGNGRINNYDNGGYFGWTDALGFDEFRIAGFENLTNTFGGPNAIALDDVRASLIAPVPVPAGIFMLGSALLGFGALRRNRRIKG